MLDIHAGRATLEDARAWQLDELAKIMADVQVVADRQGSITIEFDNAEAPAK